MSSQFGLDATSFSLAVCGLRVKSEHEDECCVIIELLDEAAQALTERITTEFIPSAKRSVSKGAKPDQLLVGKIPMVLSKGIVNVPELVKIFKSAQ